MAGDTPSKPSWVESVRLRHSMDQDVWDALDELVHRRGEVSDQRSLLRQKDAEIEALRSAINQFLDQQAELWCCIDCLAASDDYDLLLAAVGKLSGNTTDQNDRSNPQEGDR